jgi:hypothetical protein
MSILSIYGADNNAQTVQSSVSLDTIKQSLERICGLDTKCNDKIAVILEHIKAQLVEHPDYVSIDKKCSCEAYLQAMDVLQKNHEAIANDTELQSLVQAISVLDQSARTKVSDEQEDRAPRPAISIPGAPIVTTPEIVDMPKDITVERDLLVGGNETVAGNVTVQGNETIGGDLYVDGSVIIIGPIGISGDLSLDSNLILPKSTATVGVIYTNGANALANRFISNPGTDNTFVGERSGNLPPILTTGSANVAIGKFAGLSLVDGGENTLIGYQSGLNMISTSFNTCVGGLSGKSLSIGAGGNTLIGDTSGSRLTDGADDILIGVLSGYNYTGLESHNIVIGGSVFGATGENQVIRLGDAQANMYLPANLAVNTNAAGTLSIASASPTTTLNLSRTGQTTAVLGDLSIAEDMIIPNSTSSAGVIYKGSNSLVANRFISNPALGNTFVGKGSGSFTPGNNNTAIGSNAGEVLAGSNNNLIGSGAGVNVTTGNGNILIGNDAGFNITTGGENICLGNTAGSAYTTQSNNICIGQGVTGTASDSQVIRLGFNQTNMYLPANLAINTSGLGTLSIGTTSSVTGINIGTAGATGPMNIGTSTSVTNITLGKAGSTTDTVTFLGDIVLPASTNTNPSTAGVIYTGGSKGSSNRFISNIYSVNGASAESNHTFIGQGAGSLTATGFGNTAIGYIAGNGLTIGSQNTIVGVNAAVALQGGSNNVCIGVNAGGNLISGGGNIIIGTGAGTSYPTDALNNICIGNVGDPADAGHIRIGTTGVQGHTMLTGNVYLPGNVILNSNIPIGSHETLSVDPSDWTVHRLGSSRRYKENIVDLRDNVDALMSLRPVEFNYISDTNKTIQAGLIAEEVEQVMPQLVIYDKDGLADSVKYQDLTPMLLQQVQKQYATIAALQARVVALEGAGK